MSGHCRQCQTAADGVSPQHAASAEKTGSVSPHQPHMDTVARELTQPRSPSNLFFCPLQCREVPSHRLRYRTVGCLRWRDSFRLGSVSPHQPHMGTVACELTQPRSPSELFFALSSAVRSHRTSCGTGRWGVCVGETPSDFATKRTMNEQAQSARLPNQRTTQRCACMFAVSTWTGFVGLGRIQG